MTHDFSLDCGWQDISSSVYMILRFWLVLQAVCIGCWVMGTHVDELREEEANVSPDCCRCPFAYFLLSICDRRVSVNGVKENPPALALRVPSGRGVLLLLDFHSIRLPTGIMRHAGEADWVPEMVQQQGACQIEFAVGNTPACRRRNYPSAG